MPFTGWCSEEFDEALHNAQQTFGEARRPYIDQMDRAFQTERPYIYLAGVDSIGAYLTEKLEMPADSCPYYGSLASWYTLMNTEVK